MDRSKAFSLYLGIFFTTLSAIVFEISLTKIFSVTLWYHFAYFVVSLALFGIGAGGLAAFFLQDYLKTSLHRVLIRAALLQFASIVLCLLFLSNYNVKLGFTPSQILALTLMYLICSIPFVLTGLILALTMRSYSQDAPKLYCSDLIGSAIGCIVFILAISCFSGPTVVLVSAILAVVASGGFALCDLKSISPFRVSTIAVIMLGLIYLNLGSNVFKIKYTKTHQERADILLEKWSPLARIAVYPSVFFQEDETRPFGWGMSDRFKPEQPVEQLWITQDACAGTPITRFDGDLSKLEFLKYDVTSMPYYAKPNPKVFIVGVGGGRDALTALVFGSPSIVACDINPVIVNAVKETYRDFAGNLYELPQVQVEVAEARNFIRNSTQRFDIIQISLIDSWAATTAGAFSLAENNLYTVEAFADYFEHLNEDGILAVTRFLFTPRNQSLRVAIVARKALETMGIEQPQANIAVIGTSRESGAATILAKRTPLNQEEIRRIVRAVDELGFEILYLPGQPGDRDFAAALTTQPLEQFSKTSFYDLRPVTDDRPFFFQMVYFSKALRVFFGEELVGQKFNYYAPGVLVVLLLISSILILLFYITPLVFSRKVEGLPKPWGLYFILLGLGFMFVEIPLLQKGSLYLGHPTYSLSIVLFSMLVFTGLGSYFSSRIGISSLFPAVGGCLFAAGLFVALATACLEWIVPGTIGFPLAGRTAIMVFFTGTMAFLMGTAFPSGIRLLGRSHQNAIPWVWALNGGASVLGSIIAMAIAMSAGYRLTLIAGAATYLLASLVVWRLAQSKRSDTAAETELLRSTTPHGRPRRGVPLTTAH